MIKTLLKTYLVLSIVIPITLDILNIITTNQAEGYVILFFVIPSGFIMGYLTADNKNI